MLWDEFRQNDRKHRVAAYAVTEQEARESVALTYGMISFVDDPSAVFWERLTILAWLTAQ